MLTILRAFMTSRSGQQNFVYHLVETDEWLWIGDQWHHSSDDTFAHSGQFWSPLAWDDSSSPPMPKPFGWVDNFTMRLPALKDAASAPPRRLKADDAARKGGGSCSSIAECNGGDVCEAFLNDMTKCPKGCGERIERMH